MFGKDKQETKVERNPAALGRNDFCHCGSGKKYKKCCMAKDEAAAHDALEQQWGQAAGAAKEKAEKTAKETPPASPKRGGGPSIPGRRRTTFVPHQVNMPRRSGGG